MEIISSSIEKQLPLLLTSPLISSIAALILYLCLLPVTSCHSLLLFPISTSTHFPSTFAELSRNLSLDPFLTASSSFSFFHSSPPFLLLSLIKDFCLQQRMFTLFICRLSLFSSHFHIACLFFSLPITFSHFGSCAVMLKFSHFSIHPSSYQSMLPLYTFPLLTCSHLFLLPMVTLACTLKFTFLSLFQPSLYLLGLPNFLLIPSLFAN